MLKDILKKINEEGYFSKSVLAKSLNSSEQTVEDALNQLVRMGYLIKEETGQSCATACSSCPMAKTCGKEIVQMYRLTDKGLDMVKDP
ncbi:MAG TPA: FeoC-like transcriptional regulator [Oscillospiraceae bacterium]|jgi:predicted transcriptional regulator|nr:FeoC-like transcriptional regulator [Oscillospiraceae bacterium]